MEEKTSLCPEAPSPSDKGDIFGWLVTLILFVAIICIALPWVGGQDADDIARAIERSSNPSCVRSEVRTHLRERKHLEAAKIYRHQVNEIKHRCEIIAVLDQDIPGKKSPPGPQ